jgi:flavin-dependent dehydrogenase
MLDWAIIIVGAGPAGISTWLHLQKYAPHLADRTLVIEKAVFPRDKLCAGGVGGWSAHALAHLEIELDIPSLFVSDLEFRFGAQIDHLHEPGCFRVVQRKDFDHALVTTAVKRGLVIHEDEKLTDVIRERNGLRVRTSKQNYRVKAIIGADGAFSMVRRMMLTHQRLRLAPTIQIFAAVESHNSTEFYEKKIILNFTAINEGLQGYAWRVPCLHDGVPSIAHGIVDFRICPDQPRADMKKIFDRELQSRNIRSKPESWASHPIHWFSKEDVISRPNVILVGDAAGIEPVLGGGIHMALSYGQAAAEAAAAAFRKNDFSFQDYKKRIQSHIVGETIHQCTLLARQVYSGKMNPIEAARELFTTRDGPLDLLPFLSPEAPSYR